MRRPVGLRFRSGPLARGHHQPDLLPKMQPRRAARHRVAFWLSKVQVLPILRHPYALNKPYFS